MELNSTEANIPQTNFLEMLNSLVDNQNIILRTELINTEETNHNGCSEEFINNIEEREVDDIFLKLGKQCSICLEDFKLNDKYMILPCSIGEDNQEHVFHCGNEHCSGIKEWLKRNNSCPLCRKEFPKEEAILNPNALENRLTDIITNYISEIEESNEQRDIQLAIEASLND